jgi:hypothetical protein
MYDAYVIPLRRDGSIGAGMDYWDLYGQTVNFGDCDSLYANPWILAATPGSGVCY